MSAMNLFFVSFVFIGEWGVRPGRIVGDFIALNGLNGAIVLRYGIMVWYGLVWYGSMVWFYAHGILL